MYCFPRHDFIDTDYCFDIFFVWLAFKIYNITRFGIFAAFGNIYINILHIRNGMDSKIIGLHVFNDNLFYDVSVF